jgi:hypothetical protein
MICGKAVTAKARYLSQVEKRYVIDYLENQYW